MVGEIDGEVVGFEVVGAVNGEVVGPPRTRPSNPMDRTAEHDSAWYRVKEEGRGQLRKRGGGGQMGQEKGGGARDGCSSAAPPFYTVLRPLL